MVSTPICKTRLGLLLKLCVSVCLTAACAPGIQLNTPKLLVQLYVCVRARSSKVCDVSCLSEYECLTCFQTTLFRCLEDSYVEGASVHASCMILV